MWNNFIQSAILSLTVFTLTNMENSTINLDPLISKINEPLLISNYLKWDVFNWNLHKWSEVLGEAELDFRHGCNARTDTPQWEKSTPSIKGNFKDLLNFTDSDRWLYFDYKYLKHWLLEAKELRENVDFSELGLKHVSVDDSTIWIGTKGAHTPCHVDTYGCNVVVQVHGQKLWLLFKPDEDLKGTRVPYEESTVYSRLNFFSPSQISDFEGVHNGKLVVLNPGDVLVIPNKWWHYVESLDKSISINTWLPLHQDDYERKRECLLQVIISSFMSNVDQETQKSLLNPNSYDILQQTFTERINFLDEILKVKDYQDKISNPSIGMNTNDLMKSHPFVKKIENMSDENFKHFLENQSKRFSDQSTNACILEEDSTLKKITHAFTHPDIIDLILKKILEK